MARSNNASSKNADLKWTQAVLVLMAVGMIFGAILST